MDELIGALIAEDEAERLASSMARRPACSHVRGPALAESRLGGARA